MEWSCDGCVLMAEGTINSLSEEVVENAGNREKGTGGCGVLWG